MKDIVTKYSLQKPYMSLHKGAKRFFRKNVFIITFVRKVKRHLVKQMNKVTDTAGKHLHSGKIMRTADVMTDFLNRQKKRQLVW